MSHEPLAKFVERHLVFDVQCRGHCDAPASFRFLSSEADEVVGAYCCPEGFVSRVIHFSLRDDMEWFYTFLSGQLGEEMIEKRDLRVATRHGWELGEDAADELRKLALEGKRPVIEEVYWTRYPRTEAEKRMGAFICSNLQCGRLFVQEVASKAKLCPQCR